MEIRSQIDRYSPLNWRLRYRVMLFLVLALVLMPAAIFATSDTFSDVPDSNIFHNAINAIYGARATSGTSPGFYSPSLNVTREQMAAFLHRGLPRLAYNASDIVTLGSTYRDTGVVTIDTGGAPGGTGFVSWTPASSPIIQTQQVVHVRCNFKSLGMEAVLVHTITSPSTMIRGRGQQCEKQSSHKQCQSRRTLRRRRIRAISSISLGRALPAIRRQRKHYFRPPHDFARGSQL